jgi:hypothetical protein
MKHAICCMQFCCVLESPKGCAGFHPEGMAAISPESRSESGVGWNAIFHRPRRGRIASGVPLRPFQGRLAEAPSSNRWWRCAYHRLMATNPSSSRQAGHQNTQQTLFPWLPYFALHGEFSLDHPDNPTDGGAVLHSEKEQLDFDIYYPFCYVCLSPLASQSTLVRSE